MTYYVIAHDPKSAFIYGDASFSPVEMGCYSNLWQKEFLPEQSICSIRLSTKRAKITNDIFTTNSGFVISEKIQQALKSPEFKLNAKTHKATIKDKENKQIEEIFYFCEFFDWIDCIDKDKSSLSTEKGIITSIKYLSIDKSKTDNLDLFFLKDTNYFKPVISQKLYEHLKKIKTKGVVFIPEDQFTFEP